MSLDPLQRAIDEVNRLLKEKKPYMSSAQITALRKRRSKLKRAIELITEKYRRNTAHPAVNT